MSCPAPFQRPAFPPLPASPSVSVILTSYNYAQYVAEAIRSVFAQTYPNVELIIVDDGSADTSRAVIEATLAEAPKTMRVETVFQEHAGQAAAWNKGFQYVQGDIVAFLDSDDTWRPEKLEAMVEFIRRVPEGGVFQHQLEVVGGCHPPRSGSTSTSAEPAQDLGPLGTSPPGTASVPFIPSLPGSTATLRLKQPKLLSADLFQEWLALKQVNVAVHQDVVAVFVPTSGLLWRREVLERLFPLPAQLTSCPDAFLTRTACALGPLCSHPAVLGAWREHGANAGQRTTYSFHQFWRPVVMPALNQWYAAHGLPIRFTYHP
ncbi:MAG: glycosyltransferase family 2 protein, partial [Candidatus Hydrogenedentes bacterium]|nr:glycosyltransferase family 2 protein [Candidatus Hydrogenedentota bacterium]